MADGFDDLGSTAWSHPAYPDAAIRSNAWSDPLFPPPEPKTEPPPTPEPSTMAGGVWKALEQAPTDIGGGLINAVGAVKASAGTAIQSAASNAEDFTRRQLGVFDQIDAHQAVPAMDDPWGYADASTEQRADIRKTLVGDLAAMPKPEDTGLGQVGGAIKAAGQSEMEAGAEVKKYGEDKFPLTDEEQKRSSVQIAKMGTGLLPYLVASLAGPEAVAALAGVQGAGSHYEAAKKTGASDEDAAKSALFGGASNAALMMVPIHQAVEVAATLPSALMKGQFLKAVGDVAKGAATMLGFSQLQTVADNVVAKSTYAPDQSVTQGVGENMGVQAAVGALLPFGAMGVRGAAGLARRALPERANVQPRPVAPDPAITGAPNLDFAIAAANRAASTTEAPPPIDLPPVDAGTPVDLGQTRGTPIDVRAETEALSTGDSRDLQQAALLKLFDNAGRGTVREKAADGSYQLRRTGTVEQAPDGGYQYRTTNAAGDKITHPIEVWQPSDTPEPDTISPDTANALRDHYGQAGLDVVFYKHDPAIAFDGAVDPNQPDTIFLSNNPARNIAQVAAHELTHVLSTTALPDGTSLGELLNQMVAAGLTPAGWRYAAKMFGVTAPKRETFPEGDAGTKAHADAVTAHLVREMAAEIGSEAPKFQSFLPRVVDAIQQRFGDGVAKDVLTKLLDGLRTAMETVRGLFAEDGTRSQNWVTNIGEIHDTLAKMYAERFGTPVEREQARLAEMRDRAERDRVVTPETPPEALPAVSGDLPPGRPGVGSGQEGHAAYGPDGKIIGMFRTAAEARAAGAASEPHEIPSEPHEIPTKPPQNSAEPAPDWAATRDATAARSLQLRRWLDELTAERDAQAANSPQVRLLTQTEAAILRPVGGDETKLLEGPKARLDAVRDQLDAAKHPAADTPAMAKVRDELGATAEVLGAAAPWRNDQRVIGHIQDIVDAYRRDPKAAGEALNGLIKGEWKDAPPDEFTPLLDRVQSALDRAKAKMGGATEHPGLIVTSLADGKTTHVQPPGTVPPAPFTAADIGTQVRPTKGSGLHQEKNAGTISHVQVTSAGTKISVNGGPHFAASDFERAPKPAAPAESTPATTEVLGDFSGRYSDAVRALYARKGGVAENALFHPEIGPIDMVWGEEGTRRSDGFGMAKLLAWHPEVVADLSQRLETMQVESRSSNRIRLRGQDGRAVVRLDWDGQKRHWLLTAFDENVPRRTEKSTDSLDDVLAGRLAPQPNRGTPNMGEGSGEGNGPGGAPGARPEQPPTERPPSQSLVPAPPPAHPEPVPVSPHARAAERDHALAERIARRLEQPMAEGITPLSARELQSLAENTYGGTLASGAYSRDRLYDAIELGVNRFIQRNPERFNPTVDAARAETIAADLAALKESLPTQTVRAGEKDAYQQFSTPPDYAYAANWVANLRPTDHVLEPSAGVGGLIVHAMNAGVRETTVNELSDRRRGMIAALEPTRTTGEDAAQLHNILPADVRPTVVVMNPPFSRAAERMGGRMVLDEGAKHIEQALARLEPGGRLVAIVGDSMKPEGTAPEGTGRSGTGRAFTQWWNKIESVYDVRANVGVDRDIYTKYGTSFPTRFLVIDKNPPSGRPMITGQARDAADLIERLQDVRNERSADEPVADQSGRPEMAAGGEGVAGPDGELHSPVGGVGAGEGGRGDTPADIGEPAGAPQSGIGGGGVVGVGGAGGGAGNAVVPVQSQSGGGRAGRQPRSRTRPSNDPVGGRGGGSRDGVRPDGSGERDEPGLTPPPEPVLATENAVAGPDTLGVSEAVYENYTPQRVQIVGAKKHPGALVQSAAMATVMPPASDYKPRIPAALVKSGALSDAQLEAIVYAGHAHSNVMDNGKRRGFFIGDGTGVGKGREIAGIILDNIQNGRTKAVWISEGRALINDARRDWNGMGRPATDILDHGKMKPGEAIKADKGILFTSYDTLKSEEKTKYIAGDYKPGDRVYYRSADGESWEPVTIVSGPGKTPDGTAASWHVRHSDGKTEDINANYLRGSNETETHKARIVGKTRVQQVIKWLGKDFDGVIAFDEAHNMGNATDQRGTRGVKKAAQKALAAMELQKELPNARVVYVSATGATEVSNLAYADRLGLWGEGTAFATKDDFIGQVSSGGIAGMELVARDMKALGHYIARNLSYDGVDYDRVEHVLTPDQRVTYDKLAEGWQLVLQHFNAALMETGAVDDNGRTQNSRAKSAAMSAFWGGHQRFFNQIITSMQMPSVIRGVEADLKAGRQAVLQLVNTMEAAQERGLEKARASGDGDLEDLDMTPRDQLMQMVEKSYPVQQMEEYVDDNGNLRSRPAEDSEGTPVVNKAAVAARDRLLDELGSLRVPDGPLEMLLNHFGTDKVAEVTGRKQRVVRKPDESGQMKTVVEQRGAGANVADANSFQRGKKPILVFSQAGGTGRSYHAENGSGSENARRSHYLVQGGWRADKAVQGFGRTHRTNQASAPIFHLVTTDLQGQKRFISSIARRLAQLGALTKGERRAADQGMFGMRDNLESTEAKAGLTQFFKDVNAGQVEGVTMDDLEKSMGLKMRDENGALASPPPAMAQFLNRVLSLTIDHQNRVFQAFSDRMDDAIARASAAGTLDTGVETYQADKISKISEQTVYTDPRSGAETKHVHLNAQNRNNPINFAETLAGRNKTNGTRPDTFIQNQRSGRVFAVTSAGNYTNADGRIVAQVRLTSPIDYQFLDREKVDRDNWKRLTVEQARPLWDQQVAATPEFRNSALHIITGAVLPIWDRLGGNPKIFRLQTDQGERMLGRVVPVTQVDATLRSLGAEGVKITEGPAEIAQRVLGGSTARLANGWVIRQSRVAGEPRIELVGPDYQHAEELSRAGVFSERIAYRTRFFIPTESTAAAASIERITKSRPVTALEGGGPQFSPRPVLFSPRPREEDRTPLFSALTRAVEGVKQQKATPGQWIATLKNMAGVKPEERAWTGLDDWLGKQPKSVTKADVLDYLREHQVDVREVVRSDADAVREDRFHIIDQSGHQRGDWGTRAEAEAYLANPPGFIDAAQSRVGEHTDYAESANPTKFGQYTLPGGQNYREMLLTLPPKEIDLSGEPKPITDLPEGYDLTFDRMADRSRQWSVTPPGQAHGRPFAGSHDSQEAAVRSAVRIINADAKARWVSEVQKARSADIYRSSHWDEPNVLAHARFSERIAPDGAKVLHIEEVQSDWGQQGRKQGYQQPLSAADQERVAYLRAEIEKASQDRERMFGSLDRNQRMTSGQEAVSGALWKHQDALRNELSDILIKTQKGVPPMPFKTTWPMLAMKRMTQFAVDHGFDRVAWTPGDVQADRYSLAKQVDSIIAIRRPGDKYDLTVTETAGRRQHELNGLTEQQLADNVGKEMAERIAQQPDEMHRYAGDGLKVGGSGMKGFYDRQLPAEVQKLVGKFGAKVTNSEIDAGDYKVNRDSGALPYRLETRNSPDIISRHATADEAWAEAERLGAQPVHSFDITDKMRQAVQSDGLPLFSPRATVRNQREAERWTPEEAQAYDNVGRIKEVKTWRERIAEAVDDIGRRSLRAWLDPYIGIKADDPAGYVGLRNANTSGGALRVFMEQGTLKFSGSTYDWANRNGGVEDYLIRPLQGEADRFIWWVAPNRAELLSAQDRENLFTQFDIDTLKATNQGLVSFDYVLPDGTITRSREAIYADSLRKLDEFNRNVLDLSKQSGLIGEELVSELIKNPFFVPFYRISENDGHFAGPNLTSGFVKQYAFKTLKGGREKLNNDLWDNAIKNWAHMIDAALRNRAAAAVLDVAETNGAATQMTQRQYDHLPQKEKDITPWIMNNGRKQYFQVDDPMLLTAISALHFKGMNDPFMKAAGKFKSTLVQGVTSSPAFMLRNFIRDSQQAIAVSPTSLNILGNIATGFKMGDLPRALDNVVRAFTAREIKRPRLSDETVSAIAGGATMSIGAGHDTGAREVNVRTILGPNQVPVETVLDSPARISAFWNWVATGAREYKKVGEEAENAQRFALYHNLRAEGTPHDYAAFAARDLTDFSLRGAGTIARYLTTMVPFLNARLQGLYKVGRSAFDQDRNVAVAVGQRVAASATKRVAIVMGATALMTLGLDALYADDEDYKKRTEYDRSNNWWFKVGDTQFRIPMGFEIAALSRIATNGVEAFFGWSEMGGRRFTNALLNILGANLSMNPTPQFVKPIVDVLQNQNFAGAPIVSMGLDRLQSEHQYTPNTTLPARWAGSAGAAVTRVIAGPQAQFLSPVQIDYLVNGYFGWLGSMVMNVADLTVRGADRAQAAARGVQPIEPGRPDVDLWNRATAGMISTEPTRQSRYIDMLYQQADAVNRVFATYHDKIASGHIDEARDYYKLHKDEIARHQLIGAVTRQETALNQQIRRVGESRDLSAERKRIEIMRLNAMRNRAAENIFGARAP